MLHEMNEGQAAEVFGDACGAAGAPIPPLNASPEAAAHLVGLVAKILQAEHSLTVGSRCHSSLAHTNCFARRCLERHLGDALLVCASLAARQGVPLDDIKAASLREDEVEMPYFTESADDRLYESSNGRSRTNTAAYADTPNDFAAKASVATAPPQLPPRGNTYANAEDDVDADGFDEEQPAAEQDVETESLASASASNTPPVSTRPSRRRERPEIGENLDMIEMVESRSEMPSPSPNTHSPMVDMLGLTGDTVRTSPLFTTVESIHSARSGSPKPTPRAAAVVRPPNVFKKNHSPQNRIPRSPKPAGATTTSAGGGGDATVAAAAAAAATSRTMSENTSNNSTTNISLQDFAQSPVVSVVLGGSVTASASGPMSPGSALKASPATQSSTPGRASAGQSSSPNGSLTGAPLSATAGSATGGGTNNSGIAVSFSRAPAEVVEVHDDVPVASPQSGTPRHDGVTVLETISGGASSNPSPRHDARPARSCLSRSNSEARTYKHVAQPAPAVVRTPPEDSLPKIGSQEELVVGSADLPPKAATTSSSKLSSPLGTGPAAAAVAAAMGLQVPTEYSFTKSTSPLVGVLNSDHALESFDEEGFLGTLGAVPIMSIHSTSGSPTGGAARLLFASRARGGGGRMPSPRPASTPALAMGAPPATGLAASPSATAGPTTTAVATAPSEERQVLREPSTDETIAAPTLPQVNQVPPTPEAVEDGSQDLHEHSVVTEDGADTTTATSNAGGNSSGATTTTTTDGSTSSSSTAASSTNTRSTS